jgi:hypothetical protein
MLSKLVDVLHIASLAAVFYAAVRGRYKPPVPPPTPRPPTLPPIVPRPRPGRHEAFLKAYRRSLRISATVDHLAERALGNPTDENLSDLIEMTRFYRRSSGAEAN